jgi:hypothetical protein
MAESADASASSRGQGHNKQTLRRAGVPQWGARVRPSESHSYHDRAGSGKQAFMISRTMPSMFHPISADGSCRH